MTLTSLAMFLKFSTESILNTMGIKLNAESVFMPRMLHTVNAEFHRICIKKNTDGASAKTYLRTELND